MGFILTIGGLLLIVTGARGTYQQFGSLVAGEFTGKNNFLYFAGAIGAIGAIGYIDALRTFSRLFLAMIIIGIVVSNKGFFANLQAAIAAGPKAPDPVAQGSGSFSIPVSIQSAGGAANAVLGSTPGTSFADNAKKAATGDNPGSDMIGQYTTQFRNWLSGK